MFGLRAKILFGFGGLLAILLAAGLLAETVIARYTNTLARAFKEDYGSVVVCQQMKENIEQMNVALQRSIVTGQPAAPAVRSAEARFEAELEIQRRESTLPGELAATDRLASLWASYQARIAPLLDPAQPPGRGRAIYDQTAYPASLDARQAAGQIIDMNMHSMLTVHGRVSDMGARATWAVRTLMISAAALAAIFTALIGRFILKPLRLLTSTVREIEQGNLDLPVPFRSGDELGTLASALGGMAQQLREYRRRDHERLVRTERTTQLAIDSLPDAVVVVTPRGMIELANQTAGRLFGLRPGVDVTALPAPTSRWLGDLHQRVLGARAGVGSADLAGYESTIETRDDGAQRFFLPRTAPILDENRNPVGATIVLADVTGLRRLDEMKNSLLSLVSHELKTPLTSTRMILHLVAGLKVGPLNEKQEQLLATARDDADRLHRIVENLLDMSRIESGRALMELRPAHPAALAAAGVEPLASAFAAQGVTLALEVPEGLPAVLADAARVGHVLVNLLNNSLRFTPAGGTVRITARADADFVEFAVSDSGAGIPRHYAHRIFEKFFRVPGQPGASGSGLGLALSRDIIEAHGGQIRADPADVVGTLVRFTLRRADAKLPADAARPPVPADESAEPIPLPADA